MINPAGGSYTGTISTPSAHWPAAMQFFFNLCDGLQIVLGGAHHNHPPVLRLASSSPTRVSARARVESRDIAAVPERLRAGFNGPCRKASSDAYSRGAHIVGFTHSSTERRFPDCLATASITCVWWMPWQQLVGSSPIVLAHHAAMRPLATSGTVFTVPKKPSCNARSCEISAFRCDHHDTVDPPHRASAQAKPCAAGATPCQVFQHTRTRQYSLCRLRQHIRTDRRRPNTAHGLRARTDSIASSADT